MTEIKVDIEHCTLLDYTVTCMQLERDMVREHEEECNPGKRRDVAQWHGKIQEKDLDGTTSYRVKPIDPMGSMREWMN